MSSRTAWTLVATLLVFLAVFAPLVASDLPLVVETGDGHLSFPAVAEWLGEPVAPPEAHTWASWIAEQQRTSAHTCIRTPWPHGPDAIDTSRSVLGPTWAHPMGCDDLGRDMLSRILHGTRSALLTAVLAGVLALVAGALLGGIAGMCGGLVDVLVLRLIELFLCFPALFLALVAASVFGASPVALGIVIAVVSWPSFARLVRAELIAMRRADFVLAARGLGASPATLLVRHMLPQLRDQIAVTLALVVAQAVVVESTLSFLGLEVGRASWGTLLARGRDSAHLGAWHLWVFPAAAIALTKFLYSTAIGACPMFSLFLAHSVSPYLAIRSDCISAPDFCSAITIFRPLIKFMS